MLRHHFHHLFLLLGFAVVVLSGCGQAEKKQGEGAGRFGMMSDNTPEYAAQRFFEYIYNDQTLSRAKKFATPKIVKLLSSYHTNKGVQRHVLNLSYDRNKVEVQPDAGNSIGRPEFAEEARVTVFFTGHYLGEKKEDIRVVDLVRDRGKWLISEIKPDKYL